MNTFTKIVSASALMLAIAAPASAAISSSVIQDIQSAAGYNSEVNVRIDGNTVSLRGFVESESALRSIERVARLNGASVVNNNVFTLGTSGYGSE